MASKIDLTMRGERGEKSKRGREERRKGTKRTSSPNAEFYGNQKLGEGKENSGWRGFG